MQKFKKKWDINNNWQLIIPFIGTVALLYSSLKLTIGLFNSNNFVINSIITVTIFYLLLKLILLIFAKLRPKWQVKHKWEMISIFLVFACTGTSSVFVSRPILKILGITKDNLNLFFYWILYVIIGFIFYQILLVCIGWLFGQFQFFWGFEKKMLSRLGFKKFLN